jgi:hypothetical protein
MASNSYTRQPRAFVLSGLRELLSGPGRQRPARRSGQRTVRLYGTPGQLNDSSYAVVAVLGRPVQQGSATLGPRAPSIRQRFARSI